ncbi:MAG TPA: biopolymer transporter ExbD [Thermoanaerobaculia bacterium]|jgi:biopolymer transport protein ExbD
MAFGSGSSEGVKAEINVTPLVDVCLVLLIIFMVVTPMLQQGIDVQLPQGPNAKEQRGQTSDLVISIKADGTVFVGQAWIRDGDLSEYLKKEQKRNPARVVVLKADKRLEFGRVRTVIRAANEAAFSRVAILTEGKE